MSTVAKLSLSEYERIVASGVFAWPNNRHIELIHGEFREMNPIGPDHAEVVERLADWSRASAPRRKVRIRAQNPLAFANLDSEPEPDIVWVARKNYLHGHPVAADVFLVIEVAQNSLDRDSGEKAELYAQAGIPEYWIVNLAEQIIEVRRDPQAGQYASVQPFDAGQSVRPLAFPDASLSIDWLFSPNVEQDD